MTGAPNAAIFAALAAATAAADAVGKRATMNMGQGKTCYKYASSEDVITEAREALSSCGLALYCRAANVRPLGTSQVEGGDGVVSTSTQWEAHLVYVLVHSSGESLEIESATPIIPGNGRPLDKALATAKTYDLAYTLRTLLLLPRLDPREIAEEPVDQRREGPAPVVATQNAGEGAEIIAALKTCDASQLVDLTRRAMKYFGSLPQDSAERSAGRAALTAAQARLA